MKIVIGTDVFYPFLEGGGEVHTYKVAKHLVNLGHEVTVVTGKSSQFENDSMARLESLPDEETVDGIQIKRASEPYKFGATVSSLPALYEMYQIVSDMIAAGDVDVANFVLYRPCLPVYFAARGKVPTVLTTHLLSEGHGNWQGWLDYDGGILGGFAQKVIEETVLRFSYDRVMAVSTPMCEELKSYYPNKKLDTVYNGVDLEQYDDVPHPEVKRNQIIFVGAWKKRKGVIDAIEAVGKAREMSDDDLQLLIIGGGGNLEPDLREYENELDYVELKKKVSDEEKIRLLKQSILLLFPSAKEGFPLVPIEALACRTPFLAYDIPEMIEMNKLTQGGVLVEYGDSNTLAKEMCRLIDDRETIEQIGETGRQSVEKQFTWEAVAKREEQIFKQAVEEWHS